MPEKNNWKDSLKNSKVPKMAKFKEHSQCTDIPWSMRPFPLPVSAGRRRLDDRNYCYTYSHAKDTLHVYDYHGRVKIGPNTFLLQPGDFTFSPKGVTSSYDLPQPGYHYYIHFKSAPVGSSEKVSLPLHLHLGALQGRIVEKIMDISKDLATPSSDHISRSAAAATLQELLLRVVIHNQNVSDVSVNSRVIHIVDHAAKLLSQSLHRPLPVPKLAEEVGLSQNYLARHFRKRFGMTIPRYLLTCRIDHARHLLMTTNIPINEIAARIGLPDPKHFNKQFRLMTGMSPSAFRLTKLPD
jgi:AraC-like DNA-binding protein